MVDGIDGKKLAPYLEKIVELEADPDNDMTIYDAWTSPAKPQDALNDYTGGLK